MKRKILLTITVALTLAFGTAGCNYEEGNSTTVTEESVREESEDISELNVKFGNEGESFTLHLYDNDTAKTIANLVGDGELSLPIYHYDDYDNWEVMQYYDIPERYEIPHDPETVTEEKAGEVYFAEPNRIVLFYGDADITAEYTRLGYFDYSDEFVSAVENNPVLEGWGNKVVIISK